MQNLKGLAKFVSLLGLAAMSAFAQFTPISTPDVAYTSSTTLVPITAANGTTGITSVTNGSQTITLSTGLQAAQVGVSGWATWSSPPNAETATPKVLARLSTLASLTLTLSTPATTFGFELEPNDFGAFPISVAFMNGATTLGTVALSPNGSSGARLFAASSSTPITSVVITATGGGNGYAIAQFRYTAPVSAVPLPGTAVLSALGILLLAASVLWARRRGEMPA